MHTIAVQSMVCIFHTRDRLNTLSGFHLELFSVLSAAFILHTHTLQVADHSTLTVLQPYITLPYITSWRECFRSVYNNKFWFRFSWTSFCRPPLWGSWTPVSCSVWWVWTGGWAWFLLHWQVSGSRGGVAYWGWLEQGLYSLEGSEISNLSFLISFLLQQAASLHPGIPSSCSSSLAVQCSLTGLSALLWPLLFSALLLWISEGFLQWTLPLCTGDWEALQTLLPSTSQ